MRTLKKMKNIMKFPLTEDTLCIIAQDKPYADHQSLAKAIVLFGFNNDRAQFKTDMKVVLAKADIYNHDPAGKVVVNGKLIKRFIYVESTSTNVFHCNGTVSLQRAFKEAFTDFVRTEKELLDNHVVSDVFREAVKRSHKEA